MVQTTSTSEAFDSPTKANQPADRLDKSNSMTTTAKLDWYNCSYRDSFETCATGFLGTVVATAALPTVIFAIVMMVNYRRLPQLLNVESLVTIFVMGLVASAVASAAGIVGHFVSNSIFPAVNASLGFPFRADVQIKLTGAFVGFLCTGWLLLIPLREEWLQSNTMRNAAATMVTCLLLTFTAMATTCFGATLSARRTSKLVASRQKPRLRFNHASSQFKLMHLFSLTGWVAGVFAIQRLTGCNVAVAFGAFLLFAAILLGIGYVHRRMHAWFCTVS